MATTTDTQVAAGELLLLDLDQIITDRNVRELIPAEIDALADSIKLLGQLTAAIVRPEGDRYVLVAGQRRYAALKQLGRTHIRAEVRDGESEHAERAAENIVRTQLNAYEEAVAVKAMLDSNLTVDGAAQALGWPKARVTARVKLLELPEQAQRLTGQGVIPLSAVDPLRAIGQVSPGLLDVLVAHVGSADGGWAARELAGSPARALAEALRHSDSGAFAAYLNAVSSYEVQHLRLGKKTEELLAEAETLYKQLDRYSYTRPQIRFAESDVDQARAAGVLLELDGSLPMIVDKPLYRELCKQAIKRTVQELREQAALLAQQRKQGRASGKASDPAAEARREHGRQQRAIAAQAHGANTDLGWSLRNGLAVVDPADLTVARFFVYGLLGSDYTGSPYGHAGELVVELAVSGIRLVIEEFRTDVTKTRKDGSRGALRIDYGDPHQPQDAVAWLWKFIDASKTAGELYGRALVVIAAQQYASRLVLPASQRHPAERWSSHNDQAAKALAKLAGPHLPATLKQLEKAIAKADADHVKQLKAIEQSARAAVAVDQTVEEPDGDELDELEGEEA